jgi:tRNA threonylcarbamoyladenosine biosynthesis protein TsaB
MIILSIRTDKPEAEVGLFTDGKQIGYKVWEAGRALSLQLHRVIEELLATQGKSLQDVQGIVCYAGPGSFTGLRIGLTVGNALAYGLDVPIVAMQDPEWIQGGIARLATGQPDKLALPFYGAPVHITQQKH